MPLGVLMLDTRFTRFVGEIGNPQSYSEPVLFEVVRGATVDKVVPAKAPPLIEDFVAAGDRLIERGADAITTGCGFLVLNQAELAARLPVPVATSRRCCSSRRCMNLLPAGQAARRADLLGRAISRPRISRRPVRRPIRRSKACAGRRVPEGDLRTAVRRQRRGARG